MQLNSDTWNIRGIKWLSDIIKNCITHNYDSHYDLGQDPFKEFAFTESKNCIFHLLSTYHQPNFPHSIPKPLGEKCGAFQNPMSNIRIFRTRYSN